MIQQTKLEFTDYSGGITENTLPGRPNVYAQADNFLITRDKGLVSRPGSAVLGTTNGQVPSGYARVESLIPFAGDTSLFATAVSDFFYQDSTPSWQILLGPGGNRAFPGNSASDTVTSAEWRGHLFLAPSGGAAPQKVYFDDQNVLQLRQAGLPKPVLLPLYTDDQLLAQAITLAVAVRNAMIAHFTDSGVGSTFAHVAAQSTTALSALVTPTSVSTLCAYLIALATDYATHITDAVGTSTYHLGLESSPLNGFTGRYTTLNLQLDTTLATPTDLDTCVAYVNDLRNRFNWHTYATLTHSSSISSIVHRYNSSAPSTTSWTGLGKNKVDLSVVSTSTGPNFDATFTSLLTYVNNLKVDYSAHAQTAWAGAFGSTGHNNPDPDTVQAPDCTDLFGAVVILAHLENLYYWHWIDANRFNESDTTAGYSTFTGTATSGSPTLTSTTISGVGIGSGFVVINASFSGGNWSQSQRFASQYTTTQSGGTGTTVIMSSNASVNGAINISIATSIYHFDLDRDANATTTPTLYKNRLALLDYSLNPSTSIPLILAQASTWLGLYKAHVLDGMTEDTTVISPLAKWYKVATAVFTGSPGGAYRYNTHVGTEFQAFSDYTFPASVGIGTYTTYIKTGYFETPPTLVSSLYTFVFRYDYHVGQVEFEDLSTPANSTQVYLSPSPQATLPSTAAANPIAITHIPSLTNTPLTNYDTGNIQVDIYRTIGNGTTFFKVGSVTNGTTTFSDTVLDTYLVSNQELYTTGGVVGNDTPPIAKYIHILNGKAYYANITENGQSLPYRIRESLALDPDSCPATFFDDLDDDVTGLTSWRNYLIALCKNSFYRVENGFNELGQGFLSHERLSDTVGCVGHGSIVRTELGIFFCGTNGIYWTDGYTYTRITTELEATYNSLVKTDLQKSKIRGTYLKSTRRIIWSMMSSSSLQDCDIAWVLDLNSGISEKCSFTTWSGGESFSPTCFAFYQGKLLRGDSRGYIFQHGSAYTSDPRVDITTAYTTWTVQPIIYLFESCNVDFGSAKVKKWVTRVTVQGHNQSDLSLAIAHKTDTNHGGWRSLVPIRDRRNSSWGDPLAVWGTQTCRWEYEGMIDAYRRFPAGSLRCDWKAIQFTNANVIIANSDTYGLGSLGARVTGSIVMSFVSSAYFWPLHAASNYTVSFESDNYVATYDITARTDTTLTISDPGATAPALTSNLKWVIRGIPVGERFSLTNFNLTWAPLSDQQSAYHGATSSDGGQNQ